MLPAESLVMAVGLLSPSPAAGSCRRSQSCFPSGRRRECTTGTICVIGPICKCAFEFGPAGVTAFEGDAPDRSLAFAPELAGSAVLRGGEPSDGVVKGLTGPERG